MSWDVDVEKGIAWIEKHIRLHDAKGGGNKEGVPARLTKGQKDAVRGMPSMHLKGGTDVTLKARQVMFSTLCLCWAAYLMVECPGIGILLVAPESTIAEFQDVKWRIITESLLKSPNSGWARPVQKDGADNKDEYRLPGSGSRLAWVDAGGTKAKASKAGVGGTYHWTIWSELAKWDWGHTTIRAIKPALEHSGCSITVDSTPPENPGQGLAYLELAREAYARTTPSIRFYFWPWWWEKSYRASTPAKNPTAKELELMAARDWDLFQLQWRREKLADSFYGPVFFWVYPETAQQALRPKGSTVFDPDYISGLVELNERNGFDNPFDGAKVLGMLRDRFGREVTGSLLTQPKWREGPDPRPGEGYGRIWVAPPSGGMRPVVDGVDAASIAPPRYWIGVDSSDGLKDGDWQVAYVIDSQYEHCATLRCRMDPMRFAGQLQLLAMLYDWAFVEFERGQGAGNLVQRYLTEEIGEREQMRTGADPILSTPYPADRFFMRPNNIITKAERVQSAMQTLAIPGSVKDPDLLAEMLIIDPETKKARKGKGNHEDYFDAAGVAVASRLKAAFVKQRRPAPAVVFGTR